MRAIRSAVRAMARLSDMWQCSGCGGWFDGPPMQNCGCS